MERQKEIFWETLNTFQEIGLLEYLLLMGSWAEKTVDRAQAGWEP